MDVSIVSLDEIIQIYILFGLNSRRIPSTEYASIKATLQSNLVALYSPPPIPRYLINCCLHCFGLLCYTYVMHYALCTMCYALCTMHCTAHIPTHIALSQISLLVSRHILRARSLISHILPYCVTLVPWTFSSRSPQSSLLSIYIIQLISMSG